MIDKIEDISIIFGAVIGLSQIYTILGVLVLSFQVLLIILKCFKKIYNHLKTKNFSKIEEDIDEAIDNLNSINRKNE